MATRRHYRNLYNLVTVITFIVTLSAKFIKKVIEKERILEFVISTILVLYAYYMISSYKISDYVIYTIPALIYAVYWIFIFNIPKRGKYNTEIHWADEDWWWSLDGWEFEEEVAKVFRKQGYKAKVTKKTGDSGVDIVMYKNKKKIIVQCKHYKDNASPESVRALWGVKEVFNADDVIMVASSGVSKGSLNFIDIHKPYYTLYTLRDIINFANVVDKQ